MSAAVQGHYAEKDDFFTPDAALALGEQLGRLGKEAEIVVHPGTDHAFFNDDRPEVHDAEESAELWALGPCLLPPAARADTARLRGRDRRRPSPLCYDRDMSARSRDLPRRSCLSTPGASEKFLAKAPTVAGRHDLPRPGGRGAPRSRRWRPGPRWSTPSRT